MELERCLFLQLSF